MNSIFLTPLQFLFKTTVLPDHVNKTWHIYLSSWFPIPPWFQQTVYLFPLRQLLAVFLYLLLNIFLLQNAIFFNKINNNFFPEQFYTACSLFRREIMLWVLCSLHYTEQSVVRTFENTCIFLHNVGRGSTRASCTKSSECKVYDLQHIKEVDLSECQTGDVAEMYRGSRLETEEQDKSCDQGGITSVGGRRTFHSFSVCYDICPSGCFFCNWVIVDHRLTMVKKWN